MTATKLNPAAAPFPCPYPYYAYVHHLAPAPPPPFPLPGACPPTLQFVTYPCVLSPQGRLGFCFPVRQYSSPPVPLKGVSAAPLHGLPPHKLMAAFSGPCGAGKRQAAAPPVASAAARAQVPAAPRKPRQEAGTRSQAVAPRPKAESRSHAVAPRPRKAAGPRARLAAQREAPPPPPSLYTKRPVHWVKPKPSELGECTTIMLRNIPNKLRSGDLISLLDEQCAHANKAAGSVVAAYDVVYLPIDFRKEANFGYAFINLTTPTAAKELYCALQNCGWKVQGSKKIIRIDQAAQQGKATLVKHLERMRLGCDKDEFLPVQFSPPRDGVNVPAAPRRIRVQPLALAGARAPRPRPKARLPSQPAS